MSTRALGTKSTTYSAPRYSSVCPRWRPKPLTSVTVMPDTPISDKAARTSSSLKGLIIAVISFIRELPPPFLLVSPLRRIEGAPFVPLSAAPILPLKRHFCPRRRPSRHQIGAEPPNIRPPVVLQTSLREPSATPPTDPWHRSGRPAVPAPLPLRPRPRRVPPPPSSSLRSSPLHRRA